MCAAALWDTHELVWPASGKVPTPMGTTTTPLDAIVEELRFVM